MTSFEGCQIIARGKGAQAQWLCRKGYDSILQSVGPFLDEHSKKMKQIEEESIEESVPVLGETVVESNHEPAAKEAIVVTDDMNKEWS